MPSLKAIAGLTPRHRSRVSVVAVYHCLFPLYSSWRTNVSLVNPYFLINLVPNCLACFFAHFDPGCGRWAVRERSPRMNFQMTPAERSAVKPIACMVCSTSVHSSSPAEIPGVRFMTWSAACARASTGIVPSYGTAGARMGSAMRSSLAAGVEGGLGRGIAPLGLLCDAGDEAAWRVACDCCGDKVFE